MLLSEGIGEVNECSMVVIQHVHQALKIRVPDLGGAVVTEVRKDFPDVSAPAQFGAAKSAYEGVLAKCDELHGEGFVTRAHVEGVKGGVRQARYVNSEFEKELETVKVKSRGCSCEVEGSNLSEKRARGVVIVGYQFRKERQGERAEARICDGNRDWVVVGSEGRCGCSIFTDAARTVVIQGRFVGEDLPETCGVVGTSRAFALDQGDKVSDGPE